MELKKKIICFFLIFQIFTNFFVAGILVDLNLYNANLRRESEEVNDCKPTSGGIVQDEYTVEWLDNPRFETPITPWYNTTEGDLTDLTATTTLEQANYVVNGEKYTKEIVLNSTSYADWTPFNRTELVIEPNLGYGVDSDGAYCGHDWNEDSGGQPYNTPRMHWRYNVSMPFDMSDYIITSASFYAIINATVNQDIDTPGDTQARWSPNYILNQHVIYDYAQFYVEISDININEENTYRIAFNQTVTLGNEGLDLHEIQGLIDPKTAQAIIDAINNVLAIDPGHDNFTIVLGIYMYCEDNYSGNDRDQWLDLRFKELNLTFIYEKKIDQSAALSWEQIGNELSGTNIDILNATLNFKYKIDKNWTESSPNSEFRILINNRLHTETIKLSNANSTFKDIKPGGLDVSALILKNINITVSIQVYMADTFALDQKYTISIDNASLLISYTETTIEETTSVDIILNSQNKTLEKSIEVTYGYIVNVTVIYKDSLNSFIPGATVRLLGSGGPIPLIEDLVHNQYSTNFSSTELSIGNNYFTIEASKKYFETVLELINIKVIERSTEILLFLDKQDKTIDKSIEMIYGNNGNITITYKDIEQVPYTHISEATVELIGLGTPKNLTEDFSNDQYYIFIDTKDLGLGNSFLTVNAYKENYTSQSIRFKIEVLERNAYLDNVSLNGIETNSIEITWNELLTISVSYNDSFTDDFVGGALVQLTATGISETFIENAPIEYSLVIDTIILKLGVNFLTISAFKENYTLASRIITVSVLERSTRLDVYLNGTHTSLFEFYNISIGESLNITVFYRDFDTNNPINSSSVKLIESGVSYNLTEQLLNHQYTITLNMEDFGVGIKFFTASAKKDNYSIALELFTLRILEKETDFLLFLNGTQYYEGNTIEVEVTDTLNITVRYLDNITMQFISEATVDLIGIGFLTENTTLQQYQITINIIDLGETVNRLIVRGRKQNYQLALIEFFVEVTERESYGELYLNGDYKTENPYINITIGIPLNITLQYRDGRTNEHISGATIQLSGDLSSTFIENLVREQYYLIINTSQLGIGLSIFSIIAEKVNFQIFTIQKLYADINRIRTNISTLTGETNIIIKPGEDVLLQIVYYDLDFNETIKGAIISYRWQFGTGFLTDSNNDGVYEITLENVPEGSYTITINANAGNNYEFISFNIVLSAIAPQQDTTLLLILLIIGSIVIAGLVSYLYAYQKILKYPKPVRKVRKYRKTLNKEKSPTTEILNRDQAFNSNYQNKLKDSAKFLKGQPQNGKIRKKELLEKTSENPPMK